MHMKSTVHRETNLIFPTSSAKTRARFSILFSIIAIALVCTAAVGTYGLAAHTKAYADAPANTAVTTNKNDNGRTGANTHETVLNTSNVNAKQFGKRVSHPVDGQVYAQPLFLPNVTIDGSTHNVTYVATEHNKVYAFDTDSTDAKAQPLWQASLGTPMNGADVYKKYGCCDVKSATGDVSVGITGTPVIDPGTGTLYVVTSTEDNGQFANQLHALDVTTGKDKAAAETIAASVPGKGYDNSNGTVSFNPQTSFQRAGLLLLNGNVYIANAGYGDTDPYHAWVLGYHFDGTAFQQVGIFNTTPDDQEGGIWQSGGGLAADSDGNIYASVGNGTFTKDTGGTGVGDSIIKLSTQNGLQLQDYFTPFNQQCLDSADLDLGSGGTMLFDNELINAGKEGRIYVVDRGNLGKYTSTDTPCNNQGRTDADKVVQETSPDGQNPANLHGGMFSTSAYWNGLVYAVGTRDAIKAFQLTNGKLSDAPVSQTPEQFTYPGGNTVVSANGTDPNTAIVWTIAPAVGSCAAATDHCNPTGDGTLRAFQATDLSKELYSSSDDTTNRDVLPTPTKFSVPTVANGNVIIGTQTTAEIYGLLGQNPPAPPATDVTVDDIVQGTGVNQFNYVGNWGHCGTSGSACSDPAGTLYKNTNSWSNTKGDYATVSFNGTQIKLYGVTRANHGIGTVSIDNGSEINFDLYSAKDAGNQLIWTSPTLPMGNHVLKVSVTGTKSASSTDSFVTLDSVTITGQSNTIQPTVNTVDDSVTGTGDNQFNYTGNWGHCGGSSCISPAAQNPEATGFLFNDSNSWSNTKGDSVSVSFTGSQIQLYSVLRPNHGIAVVSVDGGSPTNVDLYAAADAGNQSVWTSPVLTEGHHTLTVQVAGDKNASSSNTYVAVDRVDIIS